MTAVDDTLRAIAAQHVPCDCADTGPHCHECCSDSPCIAARTFAALTEAERERDEAIAHDRQPYPTAAAYEAVCAALIKANARADAAEAEKAALVEALTTAISALENYGRHHEWCAKQYCTCGYGGQIMAGRRAIDDLTPAANAHDERIRREERERLRGAFGNVYKEGRGNGPLMVTAADVVDMLEPGLCRFMVAIDPESPAPNGALRECGLPASAHPVVGQGRFVNHKWLLSKEADHA